jgi:hypothetical protein
VSVVCLQVLWNLAVSDSSKTAIVQAGGIPALVALLERGSGGAREAGAGALSNLALHAPYKARIAAEGAVAPLVQMLAEREPLQVRRTAASSISQCQIIQTKASGF